MFGWQLLVLHAITGVCTPVCLSAASISVEAVTPPFGDERQIPRFAVPPRTALRPTGRLLTRVLLSKSYFQLCQQLVGSRKSLPSALTLRRLLQDFSCMGLPFTTARVVGTAAGLVAACLAPLRSGIGAPSGRRL